MAWFKKNKGKAKGKNNNKDNNNENRSVARDLVVGDTFKVQIPVSVLSIKQAGGTLHDALNRGQKIIKFKTVVDYGPLQGYTCDIYCTETDRIDILMLARRPLLERIRMWWKTLWLKDKK